MSPSLTPDRGTGDMFLKIKGARAGVIKGESQDGDHKDEIEVVRWSWGITGGFSGTNATSQSKMSDLKILKRVDRATAPLMTAMRQNEEIQEAVLTVRKAGEGQLEFLIITIFRGRITGITVEAGDVSGGSDLLEQVSFGFNEIRVKYVPQGKDGRAQPSLEFNDQWSKAL